MANNSRDKNARLIQSVSDKLKNYLKEFRKCLDLYKNDKSEDVMERLCEVYDKSLEEISKIKGIVDLNHQCYKNFNFMQNSLFDLNPEILKKYIDKNMVQYKNTLKECNDLVEKGIDCSSKLGELSKNLGSFRKFLDPIKKELSHNQEIVKIIDDLINGEDYNSMVTDIYGLEFEIVRLKRARRGNETEDSDREASETTSSSGGESESAAESAVPSDEDVDYTSLAATIETYLVDYKKSQTSINNDLHYGENTPEKRKKVVEYRDMLESLQNEIINKSRPVSEIRDDFHRITESIKEELGYEYGKKRKGRKRKVISAKKALLGLGGFVIGTYSIISLMESVLFFSKYSFLYGSATPFVLPSASAMLSILMLKGAFSKDKNGKERVEENVLKKVISKINSKFEEKLNKFNLGRYDEDDYEEEDEMEESEGRGSRFNG